MRLCLEALESASRARVCGLICHSGIPCATVFFLFVCVCTCWRCPDLFVHVINAIASPKRVRSECTAGQREWPPRRAQCAAMWRTSRDARTCRCRTGGGGSDFERLQWRVNVSGYTKASCVWSDGRTLCGCAPQSRETTTDTAMLCCRRRRVW